MGEKAAWFPEEGGLQDLTPTKVRDYMVECFYHSRSDEFRHHLEKQGKSFDPESLRRLIRGVVRSVFREVGADFDAPTVKGLERAVQVLAKRSWLMGTSRETIDANRDRIMLMIRSI